MVRTNNRLDSYIYKVNEEKKVSSHKRAEYKNQITTYGKSNFINQTISRVKSIFEPKPLDWVEIR